MNDALLSLARKKGTTHRLLNHVQYARLINSTCGGIVIAPWEVDQLTEEWLEMFVGLADLPSLQTNSNDFEALLARRRKANPNYRKYLS